MPFYAVAYGHVCRYEKAKNENKAVRLAFGVDNSDGRATVLALPKSPRYISQTKLRDIQLHLAKLHFERTGGMLGGWEKELKKYNPLIAEAMEKCNEWDVFKTLKFGKDERDRRLKALLSPNDEVEFDPIELGM